MEIIRHEIDGVVEIRPKFHRDARGWFAETFNRGAFEAAGLPCDFVQDNHSLSRAKGTLRGLHFQLAAARPGQARRRAARRDLRRRGRPPPRLADLRPPRRASRSRPRLGNQLLIPDGFAHGFCTLEPDTEVVYKVPEPLCAGP